MKLNRLINHLEKFHLEAINNFHEACEEDGTDDTTNSTDKKTKIA